MTGAFFTLKTQDILGSVVYHMLIEDSQIAPIFPTVLPDPSFILPWNSKVCTFGVRKMNKCQENEKKDMTSHFIKVKPENFSVV